MRKLTDVSEQLPNSKVVGAAGQSRRHESGHKHVSGEAVYIADRPDALNQLHCAVGQSQHAHAKVLSMDLSAVHSAEGVVAVITAEDVPGHVDIGPVFPGDPVLVQDIAEYLGQPLFAVAATSHELARKAVKLAKVEYEVLAPVLCVKQGLKQQHFVRPPLTMRRGDSAKALAQAKHRLKGELMVGGQEHFYLEGQVCAVEPQEDGGMLVYTSSQHPSEVQKLVAEVLGLPFNLVVVDTRRMGGGFGGKETQAAPWACICALLANVCNRPVRMRLSRSDDMTMTGKRHPFYNRYEVGFDQAGLIQGIEIEVNGDCGYSPDLSDAIVDRAMFHSDNAYYLGNATVTGNRVKTNTVSHTAFRGFGGPQGMMIIEKVMDDIARFLGKDPLEVRIANLYGGPGRDVTHYHQQVEHDQLGTIINKLVVDADYHQRREAVVAFNQNSAVLKKGIALTPVKFGISFTVQHLNQAGALIQVYTDGTILLNHGGTEMGQGLFTKVAQIVAAEFQVDIDTIAVSATRTDKVPNTSPTAASSGTDLNGKAAQAAAKIIKTRLIDFAAEHFEVGAEDIRFENSHVLIGKKELSFAELVQLAYLNRVSLSATGFYKTPKIHFDRQTGKGRPFFYFANGAAVSEVIVDTLTGEYKLLRTDILHDVGASLNPALDIGQIEGAFVQGMGWLTTEELQWNERGQLLSHNPATYKIPAVSDVPAEFHVQLLPDEPNREHTVYHSKAVGEPPFMLGISVWSALRDAISSVSGYRANPPLDTPATPERVLWAVAQSLEQQQ